MKSQRHLLISIVLLSIFFQSSTKANMEDFPLSVRQIGLGYTINFKNPDPLLLFSNPSSLAFIKNWSTASFYAQPYGMKELNITSIGFAKRYKKLTFGLGISQFGFDLYREQKIGLGLAMHVTSSLQLGFAFRYQQIKIKNYGETGSFTLDAGWVFTVSPKTKIAGSFQNVPGATIGQDRQPLPQILRMGVQFQPIAQVLTFAELYKDISFKPEGRFGIEIKAIESLFLRVGITRNPARFTGGFGLNIFGLQIDYGFNHHQVLGYTHAVGLIISK